MYTALGDTQSLINNNLMDLQRFSIMLKIETFAGKSNSSKT